jgi:hypothetical protein
MSWFEILASPLHRIVYNRMAIAKKGCDMFLPILCVTSRQDPPSPRSQQRQIKAEFQEIQDRDDNSLGFQAGLALYQPAIHAALTLQETVWTKGVIQV